MEQAKPSSPGQPQGAATEEELNVKYPNRPRNHSDSFPFHALYQTLFNPLSENKKRPTGPAVARKKQGPHGPKTLSPHEVKTSIVERFVSRWRKDVGSDIYPAFRLIVPDKDRERAMYGLKEKTIGKLLVRIVKIDKNSEDGFNLLNWKLPGQKASTAMAGDFAGRCYEVLSKRAARSQPGEMTVTQVNQNLDQLSLAQKEDAQFHIMEDFYQRMNAEEMMWLIRIILRQMKIGATERTFFDVWHPDAHLLFNVSSNLRRVCWELYDPSIRLESQETDISIMQCFQPQLAQFQMHSFEKMVQRMRPTETDNEFWIEEKLDGERMQLHMVEDDRQPGGKRFAFWSRKAKEYTYLYGNGLEDDNSALTRHLKDAFDEGVRNIILDGEMITWDPDLDKIVAFGTLKTAALSEQKNPFSERGERPLFRVFDILYLNDQPLTAYTLRDRRNALESAVKSVYRRLELHQYSVARTAADVEPKLREIVAEASEGLVLKNPRSAYRLNARNDDWMKVKPEYMTGFGEDLDCLIVGGYYGSGRRGGNISSFMCGVRVNDPNAPEGVESEKFWSFFKVGGGFTAGDYASIRHHTEGKWHDWDRRNPPSKYIELAGGDRQLEQPDVWIRPRDSIVVSVKAASVNATDDYRTKVTLRFPRFKRVRLDRDWSSALTWQDFLHIKEEMEKEQEQKQFTLEQRRRHRPAKRRRQGLEVAGAINKQELEKLMPAADAAANIFAGLTFLIVGDSVGPPRRSKAEIEAYVKAHGAAITHTVTSKTSKEKHEHTICIADRSLIKVRSLTKDGTHSIVRPEWLFDCVEQAIKDVARGREPVLLPWERKRILFEADKDKQMIMDGADEWFDSFARDLATTDELRCLMNSMPTNHEMPRTAKSCIRRMKELNEDGDMMKSQMFTGCVVWIDNDQVTDAMELDDEAGIASDSKAALARETASYVLRFAGGKTASGLEDELSTHVVGTDPARVREVRETLKSRRKLPHIVALDWIHESWAARTLLDEDRFALA